MSDGEEEVVRQGTCVRDIDAEEFIKAFAQFLKNGEKVSPPSYTAYTKTACFKERTPLDDDWFFVRAAAVARKIYLKPRGVGQLTRCFGGKERRGTRTNKFSRSSRGIIRECLKQLQAAGYVEPHRNGGRKITQLGQMELDTVAVSVRFPEED